jgi:glycosyltransferase involved in cell wall biosynthesis
MKILFLTNAPVPVNRETDAHFQELDLLASHVDGKIISAFPLSRPNSFLPRTFYGMHNRREIRLAAKDADLIHIFSPILHPYLYMRRLVKKPLVYSTLTPVTKIHKIKGVDQYVVYDEDSRMKLQKAGIQNVMVSPPFVNFQKVKLTVPPLPFTLLMASAPWEKSQFKSKGVLLLIELLGRIPELQIIFIWRDILFDDMNRLVRLSPYADQMTLINERVDMLSYLEKSHAVVLLAEQAALVKSYPHSLMEGLLAGRPVVTSPTIAMSRLVAEKGYGEVLNSFSLDALEVAVRKLMDGFDSYQQQLLELPEKSFDKSTFVNTHKQRYANLLSS